MPYRVFTAKDPIGFNGADLNLYGYTDSVGKPQVNLYQYAGANPVNMIDPLGLSERSVILGTISAGLNTASLATIWNPVAATYLKAAGIGVSALTVVNAGYEYYTGQISGTELAITAGTEAANVVGGFAAKPVEALVTGLTRGVGIANTTVDAVKSFAPSSGGKCK
jgi:hypothetical protein